MCSLSLNPSWTMDRLLTLIWVSAMSGSGCTIMFPVRSISAISMFWPELSFWINRARVLMLKLPTSICLPEGTAKVIDILPLKTDRNVSDQVASPVEIAFL